MVSQSQSRAPCHRDATIKLEVEAFVRECNQSWHLLAVTSLQHENGSVDRVFPAKLLLLPTLVESPGELGIGGQI